MLRRGARKMFLTGSRGCASPVCTTPKRGAAFEEVQDANGGDGVLGNTYFIVSPTEGIRIPSQEA